MFGRRVHVVVEDEAESRTQIASVLQAGGVGLESMERVDPSLEDVFVALIREEGGAREG
jgi:hypothetical protein